MTSENVGIEEARKRLGDLVTIAQQGTDITITRNGRPVARLTAIGEKMTTLKITEVKGARALYRRYPGQNVRQPVHIALDLETGELGAEYNPEPGSHETRAVPGRVAQGHARWYPIPCLTASAANELLHRLAPLAQTVLDGSTIEWDAIRDGVVGKMTPAASDAHAEIQDICEEVGHEAPAGDLIRH
jgi:prevent-host-death family protein